MAREKPIAEIRDGAVYVMQSGTPVYVKTADICKMTHKTNQWIGQLTSQGDLSKVQTPYGAMFPLADTISSYIEILEERLNSDEKAAISIEKDKASAALAKAKATKASLEVKELLGKMHRSEDVAAMTEDLIFAVRSALMALPGRLAIPIANASDAAEASEIITREIYEVMNELANYKYDAAKYEERVRTRLNMEMIDGMADEED